MWDIAAIVGLVLCCLAGVILTAVRLPGTWLIVVAALAYGWWSQWQRLTVNWVLVLAGIALVGEAVEFLSSVVTARKAGASRRAGWGGLIGGIVGMIFLSIPVPIIGTIIGAILGCFIGAAVGEYSVRQEVGQGTRVGALAAVGFVVGMVMKTAAALVMAGLLLTSVVCSPSSAPTSIGAEEATPSVVAP